mgnify:FL=1
MADGTLKVGQITTSSGSGTITIPDAVTVSSASLSNAPAFKVGKNATQSIANTSFTKMTWQTEEWDTNNAFASDKFTVPSGQAGKYWFQATTEMPGIDDGEFVNVMIFKNGSSANGSTARWYSPGTNLELRARTQVILNLAVGDYIEAYLYQNSGDAQTASADESSFTGYKLLGV